MSCSIEDRLKKLISTSFGMDINDVHEDMHIDNTPSWDSLNNFKLILEMENEFGIQFDASNIVLMTSYPVILNTIEKQIADKPKGVI